MKFLYTILYLKTVILMLFDQINLIPQKNLKKILKNSLFNCDYIKKIFMENLLNNSFNLTFIFLSFIL